MTREDEIEIRMRYREAKDKRAQVDILCLMFETEEEEICRIVGIRSPERGSGTEKGRNAAACEKRRAAEGDSQAAGAERRESETMGAGRKAVITAGDPVGVWAAWKHRMGYTMGRNRGSASHDRSGILYRVMKSGAPTKRPRLKKPKRLRGEGPSREWAWECLLEGYTKTEIAVALDVSREWIEWLLKDRRKVMPPLVTTWIFGWKGSRK